MKMVYGNNLYLNSFSLAQVKLEPKHSHLCSGILKVGDVFFTFNQKVIGNEERKRFWEDLWI